MNYSEISQYLKVMADSSRLEILDLLSCGELCACDLLQHFLFSTHIKSSYESIKDNNLITSRKDGNKIYIN